MKRSPVWILHVFIVGLALHNLVAAELYGAGVRGTSLDVVSAWKEVLLAVGLVLVYRHGLAFRPALVDWLPLAFAAVVIVYALIPQHVLGGGATHHGVLLGVRHDLLPVAAYFFGRGLDLSVRDVRRLGATLLASASAVAAFGLVDIYAIPLSWWRSSGAPGWFSNQLGFGYTGLSGLPENFVYNTGNEHPLRRLVSTFLSPLATSYMLVTALLLCAAWLLRAHARLSAWIPVTALLFAGLLWTHSRSSYIALALGLVVYAALRPQWRWGLLGGAAAVVVVGLVFVRAYPHIAPVTSFTPKELIQQRQHAHSQAGGPAVSAGGFEDASTSSHLQSLRDGIETVLRHPQGYGPGNAGSTAARTGVQIKAGESTYTELGVDAGLVGGLLFVAWSLAVLWRLVRCRDAWLAAVLVAMLALALQTDIIGVPWVVYVIWPLAGWRVSHPDTWPKERLAPP
jgi:O-Antigen ligase